jgi:flagellin
MAMVINTNVASLNAQRQLSGTQSSLNTALERLSSGLRINSAKDDAAGLAISDRMTAQIRGLNQAVRNANDGISLAQTAEGALQESTNILQRMRELAVQSANDTNSATDRASLQKEVSALQAELNRIADTTAFNGKNLLDGTFVAQKFHVGANANESIQVTVGNARADSMGSNSLSSDGTIDAATAAAADISGGNIVAAQSLTVTGDTGSTSVAVAVGATAKDIATDVNNVAATTSVSATARTTATLSSLGDTGTVSMNLYGSNTSAVAVSANVSSTGDLTSLADAINSKAGSTGITATLSADKASISLANEQGEDIKIEDFNNTGATKTVDITGASGTAATLTGGAATDSTVVGGTVSFSASSIYSVTTDTAGTLFAAANNNSTLDSVGSVDIGTQAGANNALSVVDGALDFVDDLRAGLGAMQNRFESTISNLQNVSENLSAASSRIRDADFAAETAALTRGQILQQAGVAILAQANQSQQSVLSLLG